MRLLLDSNVFYWSMFDRRSLTDRVAALIEEDANDLFVSRASPWELSIKVARGRLEMPGSTIAYALDHIAKASMTVLSIDDAHLLQTESLPHIHGDPFDRLLIAQAMVEGLTILTSDAKIALYTAPVVWN